MKKFLVERNVPNTGDQSEDEFQNPDSHVEWLESFITADKVYCIYQAKDEAAIREHVMHGNLPVNRISEITSVLTPESEHTMRKMPEIEHPVDRQLN